MKILGLSLEKSVGAVIFRRDGSGNRSFLLLHYPSGHWDFPKGHVEKGESEKDTLRRETMEETGIKDLEIIPGFRKQIIYFYRAKGREREKRLHSGRGIFILKKVVFYLAETEEQDIELSFEHVDHVWLPEGMAEKRITFPDPKKIFRMARNFLA